MKNISKLLLIIGIMLVPFVVNADTTFTCETTGYSCEFNVTANRIKCINKSTNKELELEEPMTLNTITNSFVKYEVNGVEQGRQLWNQVYLDKQTCPDHLYTMNKRNGKDIAGLLYFDASYYFKFDMDNPSNLTKYTAQEVAQLTTQEHNKDHYEYKGTFTKSGSTVGTTCTDEIAVAYNKFQDFNISYDGKCRPDNGTKDCMDLLASWKAYLPEAEEIKRKYENDSNCPDYDKRKIMDVVASQSMVISDITTTTSTEKKEKEYDFSNNGCPLGEEVTKDLSGALKVMKILAPIFVFVYTVFDTIVAITKGDVQAEGKKMLQKFLKRVAAALALFAVPVLIDVLMQLFNVWDNTGHCSFTETKTTAPATITTTTHS